MNVIALNCRGLGRAAAIRSLKNLIKTHKPKIIFLSEIKTCKDRKIKGFLSSIGYPNYWFVPPIGKAGGLILCWTEAIEVEITETSQNFINGMVLPEPPDPPWQFTGVYGPTKHHLKRFFWEELDQVLCKYGGPSLIIGDFNSIVSHFEKKGGKPFVSPSAGGLQEVIDTFGLIDLGFSGAEFTWSNRRSGSANIRERLDRGMVNESWNKLFPNANIEHLPADTSDHSPLLLRTSVVSKFRARPFRFEAMWVREASCEIVVQDAWANRRGTNAAFRLLSALVLVQKDLKLWNKEHFGNCLRLVDLLREKLGEIQKLPHSDELLAQESSLQVEIDENLARMEILWRQKSRANWLAEGDANTRYFHLNTIINRRINSIGSIKDENDRWLTDPDDIGACFSRFFEEMFVSSGNECPEQMHDLMDNIILPRENDILNGKPTEEEIRCILWSMGAQKSPGPDGMPPLFFRTYWEIVKNEVVSFVQQFFETKMLRNDLNHTFITLIKKQDKPCKPTHFRPIALCNVVYKIISKLLANRLKKVLSKCISENQSAFVPGRNITDNTIISQEIMHVLKNQRGKNGYMAIRIDMEKAYDKLEWNCLIKVMELLGFDSNFIELIYGCISSVTYSVLVNGSPVGKFKSTRGIRQGDPISPYLFILMFELLSRMLTKAGDAELIHGVKICKSAPMVNHLMYADDLVIFCKATKEEAGAVDKILNLFGDWSGQVVNKEKSSIHFGRNVLTRDKQNICFQMGLKECSHKGKHLGLPFCKGKNRKADYEFVVEQVKKRFTGWKGKILSQASRAVLIRAVIQAIPSYSMQTIAIPACICDKLDSLTRRFYWGVKEDKKHFLALVSWDRICLPKQAGGLGFRKMADHNRAFNMKLSWQMIKHEEKQWSRLLAGKYLQRRKMLDIKEHPPNCSWIWSTICKNIELVKENFCISIGDGASTLIWNHPWIPTLPGFKPPLQLYYDDAPKLVKDLILDSKEWNVNLLQVNFPPDICKEIMKIAIPMQMEPPSPIWLPTKSGKFTVKSAYLTIMDRRIISNNPTNREVWKYVWHGKLHGRHKHLLWKILNDAFPVFQKLRFIDEFMNVDCVFCEGVTETCDHLLIHCHVMRRIMFASKWNYRFKGDETTAKQWICDGIDPNNIEWPKGIGGEEFTNFVIVAFDQIWRQRNRMVYEEEEFDMGKLELRIKKVAQENWQAQINKKLKGVNQLQEKAWIPPGKNEYKFNCDASVLDGRTVIAWVARNQKGKIVGAFADYYPEISVDEGEAKAVFEAMKAGCKLDIGNMIIESDSSNVIVGICDNRAEDDRLNSHLIKAIRELWLLKRNTIFRKIPRSCNFAAHNLAKWAGICNKRGFIPLNDVPSSVLEIQTLNHFDLDSEFSKLY